MVYTNPSFDSMCKLYNEKPFALLVNSSYILLYFLYFFNSILSSFYKKIEKICSFCLFWCKKRLCVGH